MKKSELKSGMVVKTRGGELGIILLGTSNGDIIGGCGIDNAIWKPLDGMKDTLEGSEGYYDIIEVYNSYSNFLFGSLDLNKLDLVWSRPVPPTYIELTIDEIAERLDIDVNLLKIIKGTN
jgi:hypothetical protein